MPDRQYEYITEVDAGLHRFNCKAMVGVSFIYSVINQTSSLGKYIDCLLREG